MTDLDKLKAKIRALRDKTQAAGCSEAEALAAAEVAARLMAEAGLSDADIEITAASARETTSRTTWRAHIAVSVMHATNTAAVQQPAAQEVKFVGCGPWPEVAAYLYQVLTGAVRREQARFKATPEYLRRRTVKTRRAALADFAAGMVARLRRRLLDMFAATIDPNVAAASQQALSARYPAATDRKWTAGKPRYAEAQAAGYAAGDNVTLAHGVAGPDGAPLAIEGPR